MNHHILIAVVAALVNMILSSVVPCLTKKSNEPALVQVRSVFESNKQVILTSSIIVGITAYIALKVAEEIQSELPFSSENSLDYTSDMMKGLIITSSGTPLGYLSRLN